ncbi:hypothetical protein [Streptomyces spinosirectus]
MEWTTLAGTGLGALIGVSSTLLADRVRWRRDAAVRDHQERRDIYVTCLTKYRLAYESMYAAARTHQNPETLDTAVREAQPALDSPEFQEHRLRHGRAVWAARAAMRRDLDRRV